MRANRAATCLDARRRDRVNRPTGPFMNARRVTHTVPAQALDGRTLAKRMERRLQEKVAALDGRPCLAVVLVGNDPASEVYVGRKQKACRRVGIEDREHRLPESASQTEILALIGALNDDPLVHGILVQLPLPEHVDAARVIKAILPAKDVDAFHPESVGHALLGDERMAPCTPQGILHLLDEAGIPIRGADVCIVNHSNIVGKPLAAMLINRDATVTVCHKHTKDLHRYLAQADIVVTGTGGARMLAASDIRPGAVVVDVSMVRDEDGNLHGDVLEEVWDRASWVTPVPGGVGPMTIAVLLQNTVRAFKQAREA